MSEANDDNPFGDLGDEIDETESGSSTGITESESTEPSQPDSDTGSADEMPASTDPEPAESNSSSTSTSPSSEPVIRSEVQPDPGVVAELSDQSIPGAFFGDEPYPYAIRRGGWDDERSGNKKFVMREQTEEMELIAAEEIKEELLPDTDLNMTDIREAAFIVGLQNLDDVVDVLNQWGFAEEQELRQ